MDITSIFVLLVFIGLCVVAYIIFRARFKKQKAERNLDGGGRKSGQSGFKWTFDKESLNYQVANYDTLTITKSARGEATLLVMFSVGLTIVLGLFNVIPLADAIGSAIIYLPLAFFIYRGHRWAMIGVMILWTLDKFLQISQSQSAGGIIIWWLIFMPVYYKAYQVEQARKEKLKPAFVAVSNNEVQNIRYCRFCGKQVNLSAKFCSSCGKEI